MKVKLLKKIRKRFKIKKVKYLFGDLYIIMCEKKKVAEEYPIDSLFWNRISNALSLKLNYSKSRKDDFHARRLYKKYISPPIPDKV